MYPFSSFDCTLLLNEVLSLAFSEMLIKIGMSCLQNLSKDIRECYHRAEECRHKAQTASTELLKANFLQMEQR